MLTWLASCTGCSFFQKLLLAKLQLTYPLKGYVLILAITSVNYACHNRVIEFTSVCKFQVRSGSLILNLFSSGSSLSIFSVASMFMYLYAFYYVCKHHKGNIKNPNGGRQDVSSIFLK